MLSKVALLMTPHASGAYRRHSALTLDSCLAWWLADFQRQGEGTAGRLWAAGSAPEPAADRRQLCAEQNFGENQGEHPASGGSNRRGRGHPRRPPGQRQSSELFSTANMRNLQIQMFCTPANYWICMTDFYHCHIKL